MAIRKRSWKSGGEVKVAWVADYVDQHGTRRLRTFRTRKVAAAWLVQASHQVASGTHTADSVSIAVGEAADLWLERCEAEQLERSTMSQYRGHARLHIKPLLGA